jgi:hypothetical protein
MNAFEVLNDRRASEVEEILADTEVPSTRALAGGDARE